MATLIDASVLIAAERKQLDLDALLDKHGGEPVMMSAITASELLHGVHRGAKPDQRTRREVLVELLLASFPVLSFDLVAARVHARIWAQLAARGITVGSHDLLIAATAIAAGCQVATRDERSFPKIPGVSVVVW